MVFEIILKCKPADLLIRCSYNHTPTAAATVSSNTVFYDGWEDMPMLIVPTKQIARKTMLIYLLLYSFSMNLGRYYNYR